MTEYQSFGLCKYYLYSPFGFSTCRLDSGEQIRFHSYSPFYFLSPEPFNLYDELGNAYIALYTVLSPLIISSSIYYGQGNAMMNGSKLSTVDNHIYFQPRLC